VFDIEGYVGGGGGGGVVGSPRRAQKGGVEGGTTATPILYVYCIYSIQRCIISSLTMACIHTTFLYAFQDIYDLNYFHPIDG